jgi:glycosyltransferase involved in cell wall biosynthesis
LKTHSDIFQENGDVVGGLDSYADVTVEKDNTMRIAFCLPELEPLQQVMNGELGDAAFIQQAYIATGLQDRGHSLSYLAPRNLQRMVCTTDLQSLSLAPQTWSASRWFDLASKGAWRLQSWLGVPYLNVFSNYRFFDACLQCLPGHDLVYERNGLYNVGIAMACRRLKLPYVLFFDADQIAEHDFLGEPITGLLRWRARRLLRYNLRAADCVICVSEPAKIHLVNAWNVPRKKIAVFPNGVDVQRFRPDPEARREVRASLGVDANPVVLFVGSFYHWHDVATLLDSFPRVLAVRPDARLVLVGDGAERPAMMQHAIDLGIGHAVRFTGLVPHAEVPRLVAAADVAVAPYPPMQRDLWLSPMKLFEYMASGKAVIASGVGQLAEVIQDGSNGLLVPPGDVAAMAAALAKLIGDPALRSRLSQQAREDAVQKHSWETFISRLECLFAAVMAARPVNQI